MEAGCRRAIGVSNSAVADLEDLLEVATVTPHANQIRFQVGHTQDEVVRSCPARGLLVEAYLPLHAGKLLGEARLAEPARKYGVSVAQLGIRYALQRDTLPLAKSTHPEFIRQNADVDFLFVEADMAAPDAMTEPARRAYGRVPIWVVCGRPRPTIRSGAMPLGWAALCGSRS